MPRFQLKPNCLFANALIIDGRDSPAKQLALNDTAGFIAHFMVQGVDTDKLLPQIMQSEYGIPLEEAAQEVEKVKNTLMPYLEPRSYQRPHHKPHVHDLAYCAMVIIVPPSAPPIVAHHPILP